MDYSPNAFQALFEEVERQGGAHLPDNCTRADIEYTVPPYVKNKTEKEATCGCGNPSRFVSVYDPDDVSSNGGGYVTACAVCDSMGAWPRYSGPVASADAV